MSIESIDAKGSPQIFRFRTQSTIDEGPILQSREGNIPKEGVQKGKTIGVFTSGGDSQGLYISHIRFKLLIKVSNS